MLFITTFIKKFEFGVRGCRQNEGGGGVQWGVARTPSVVWCQSNSTWDRPHVTKRKEPLYERRRVFSLLSFIKERERARERNNSWVHHSLCVCEFEMSRITTFHDTWLSAVPLEGIPVPCCSCHAVGINNMADALKCEAGATLVVLGSWNNVW